MENALKIIMAIDAFIPNELKEKIAKQMAKYVVDAIETYVESTDTKIDDLVVGPLCTALKSAVK